MPQGYAMSLDHGPSRVTWVYRIRADRPMSLGHLYAYDDGTGRAGMVHRLLPLRHLMPGRYDLQFARYGVVWPVTLSRDDSADDSRMMIVEGRVPL